MGVPILLVLIPVVCLGVLMVVLAIVRKFFSGRG